MCAWCGLWVMNTTAIPRSRAWRMYFRTTPGLPDAQRAGRLVEDQHLGAEVDRAGDRHGLALTAGQRADRLLHVADVDAHREQLLAADPSWPARVSRNLSGPNPDRGSLPRKKFRQTDISGTVARSWNTVAIPAPSASRGEENDVGSPLTSSSPSRGLVDAAEDLDQRRLAGAVVAEHAGDRARVDVQRDVAQGEHAAEELGDVLELERRRHVPSVAAGSARARGSRRRSVSSVISSLPAPAC